MGLAGGRVPEPRRAVGAAGQDGAAVGAEGHGIDLGWWCRGAPMGFPEAASQSRAVSSPLPGRTTLLSGLKATALTLAWWCRGAPMGFPEAASQSRAVLSPLPVRTARRRG
jgi:hypothetical protein